MKVYAKKISSTHLYNDSGKHVAVTVLGLLDTVVAGTKSVEKDGYEAVIYALADEKAKVKKPQLGQYHGIKARKVSEERVNESTDAKVNDKIDVSNFAEGDKIKIVSQSKGKGFAGTVKRHGFHTGPKTHGSHNYRAPGSIGVTDPSRVLKGKKMSGHMGAERITQQKLTVERVDTEKKQIWVRGSIAGPNKSIILITK